MTKRIFIISSLVSLVSYLSSCLPAFAGEVQMAQKVTLTNGWNAVYLRVGPEKSADELFATWPVQWVALYDPAAFAETRQFDKSSETEGTKKAGYLVWRRGDKGASTFASVPANSILVAYATNTWSASIYGTPQAPRITWHDSSSDGFMNLVGFSVTEGADTLTDTYFSGLDVGDAPFYVFAGQNSDKPSILPATMVGARHFKDGEVLLVDSKKSSDWSGVLNVSPASGLDFGTELNTSMLEVRNDGNEERKVELCVTNSVVESGTGAAAAMPSFHYRDGANSVTNGPWSVLTPETLVSYNLSTGETWKIELAVDRTAMNSDSGTVWGTVFEFRDASVSTVNAKNVLTGGSHFRACVPVTVTDNGPEARDVWTRGLWVASAELDTVTHLTEDAQDVPAGGTMAVRLPVYVEPDENAASGVKMYLLQRFWYGRNTNGVLKVFSGNATCKEPLTGLKRLSSPFLPTDQPVVAFTNSTMKDTATVKFTVGERSRVNPMYHAQHPQHDALTSDYENPAPSGDILENYKNPSSTKPETFSITNTIEFAWDKANQAWEPEETMTGTLIWHFDGLRHATGNSGSGTLRAKGKFTMKHLTSAPVALE